VKETTNHKIRYPEPKDPDTMAVYWENQAKDVDRELDAIDPKQIIGGSAGKILIAKSTGAGVWAALKGDGTLAEDGTLNIGGRKITDPKLGIIRGRLKEDGGIASGIGFTAEKTATGVYKITFTSPYAAEPLVFVSPFGNFARHATSTLWSEGEATKARRINIYDAEGKAVDSSFQFVALEP
jgi:hypothetical protein